MTANNAVQFGWLSPVIGNRFSNHEPIVVYQDEHILPTVNDHFDSLWIADHFYGMDAKTDPFMEAWTTMTWLAARFANLNLCHHVLGHGYRPPALTAKMAATLQVFSGNRLTLGIGAGWRGDEYEAYGYDFPNPSVRFAQLEEVVQICRLMWTDPEPTFHGKHFSIDGASAPPLPEVAPPICIGAAGEKVALPLVGRVADIWHGGGKTPDDWARKRAIVDDAATTAGRDPSEISSAITIEAPLPESDTDSAELVERLAGFTEQGVAQVVMDFGHPPSPEPIHRFVEQVMAPLRS